MSLAGNKIIYEENLKESRTTTTTTKKKNPNNNKKKPSKTNVITS